MGSPPRQRGPAPRADGADAVAPGRDERFSSLLALVGGTGLVGFASRRELDLGDLIPGAAVVVLLSAGAALLVWGARRDPVARLPRRASLVALVAGAVLIALRASWITAAAGAFCVLWAVVAAVRGGRAARAAQALLLCAGCVWLSLAASSALSSAGVNFDLFGDWTARLVSLMGGVPAGAGEDTVVVGGLRGNRAFLALPQVFGFLSIAASAVFLVLWRTTTTRAWSQAAWIGRVGAAAVAAMVVRACLLIAVGNLLDTLVEYESADYPAAVFLEWPLVLALDVAASSAMAFVLWALRPSAPAKPLAVRRPRRVPVSIALLSCGAVAAGALVGSQRALDHAGRAETCSVAVDEGHSDWEKSDLPSGEDTYGDETGYNFSACFRWMRHEFGPVRRLYESVTPDLLRGTDVLVLKTPTRPFDADERRAVEEFVASGGGLVLVGDHTNVFGTGEVLNAVAEPFGVRFRYDVVFDHRARFEHVWSPEWPEDVHPIAQSIGAVRFEVGCSLECSRIDARDVVVGRGMKTLPIDYAASNFYPQIRDDSQMRHGAVTEVLALTHGAGRVVAVADSTLFSTFSVCHAGRRELLENAVRWAGREDVGEPLRWLLWGAGVALLVVLVPAAARRGPGAAGLALCLTMGAASLVNAVAAALGDGGEAANPDQPPPAEILFMSESNDRVVWPVRTLVRDPGKSFDMFFQWVNRVDEFPRLVRMAELRPREAQTVFVIEPRELTDDDAETLVGIARAGGCVVLVETEPNAGVARVAAAAEMRLDTGAVDGAATVESAFGAVFDGVPSAPWRAVAGGRPILVSRSKEGRGVQTVGAMNAVGRGWIGVFTCGALFTDAQYGYRYNVMPTGILRRRYAVQFALLRACGRAPDARTGG